MHARKEEEEGLQLLIFLSQVLGLPDGEEIMTLAFFVLMQYRRVTDGIADGQTDTLRSLLPALA